MALIKPLPNKLHLQKVGTSTVNYLIILFSGVYSLGLIYTMPITECKEKLGCMDRFVCRLLEGRLNPFPMTTTGASSSLTGTIIPLMNKSWACPPYLLTGSGSLRWIPTPNTASAMAFLLGRHLFIWPWCLGLSLRGAQSGLPRIRTRVQALRTFGLPSWYHLS